MDAVAPVAATALFTSARSSSTAPERVLAVEEVGFMGHPMVSARHGSTIEITTEKHLTPRGDCIIGVGATKGIASLSGRMKEALRSDGTSVRLTIVTPTNNFTFMAKGSRFLSMEHPTDIVIRTSDYVCGRTLAINASASARSVPRDLVKSLRSPSAVGLLRIEVLA
jgi:hypothetical protein